MKAFPFPPPPVTRRTGFDKVRRIHDRTRLFCSVLEILADDLFQIGREFMALSLSSFAADELAPLLSWEDAELAGALLTLASDDGSAQRLYDELVAQHATIVAMLPRVIDGIEAVSESRLPERPLEFVLGVLRLTQVVRHHIEWQGRVLLPFALAALSEASVTRLEAALAVRHRHSAPDTTRARPGARRWA